MRAALADLVHELQDPRASAARERLHLRGRLAEFRMDLDRLDREAQVRSKSQNVQLNALNNQLRKIQRNLLNILEQFADDFAHADENEDRLVILVFGEVNAGKSGLANHLAGLDFDLDPYEVRGQAFVGDAPAPGGRLKELPTECTNAFQGFKMPGLLWIDCPGVLSATPENANIARRLVGRADMIIVASSSDAPFKSSEAQELGRLIREQGDQDLVGIVVLTKCDEAEHDFDDDGNPVTHLRPLDKSKVDKQRDWIAEQIRAARLQRLLREEASLPVSMYLARIALGRRPDTAERERDPGPGWQQKYADGGADELSRRIEQFARNQGAAAKAAWPRKRQAAMRRRVHDALAPALRNALTLQRQLSHLRTSLAAVSAEAAQEAADCVAGRVAPCLGGNGIRRPGAFNEAAARQDLTRHLTQEVKRATEPRLEKLLLKGFQGVDRVLHAFNASVDVQMKVEPRYRSKELTSNTKGRGVGRAIGGAGGSAAGAAIGATIGSVVPGFGTVVGALVGGFMSGWLFGYLGGEIGGEFNETRTVKIPAGTNADEVIQHVTYDMRNRACAGVQDIFLRVEHELIAPAEAEAEKVRTRIASWLKAFD